MMMSSSTATYPWPSTLNVATFVTVKLDLKEEASFHIWKEQMLCLLESQDVVGFIDGEMTEPPTETEQKLWRRTDRLVKGWILGTIGRDAIDAVWNLQTARDVWLKLQTIFTPSRVGENSETDLQAAVVTGKANGYESVTAMVNSMTPEAVAIQDELGYTALHKAAMVGNTEAAEALVKKNHHLLYIGENDHALLPVSFSAMYRHKTTLKYLISEMERNGFEGQTTLGYLISEMEPNGFKGNGVHLLDSLIASKNFDLALKMIDKHPSLGGGVETFGGYHPLLVLAGMSHVFRSGQSFSWWQNLIYRLKQKLEFMLWKVVEHLVPPVRRIKEKKLQHQQALQLVTCLTRLMASSSDSKMLGESILTAAKNGICEIVEVIMKMHPKAALSRDSSGKNIFHLAVAHRFEKVLNLIYSMGDRKYLFFNNVDNQFNNYMHLSAKLAPPERLNLVPGASLQMQRELQWVKETEKLVIPPRGKWKWQNKAGRIPKEMFTEEHKKLKEEGEKWMKETATACSISAALIATVMFASAFTVPKSETGIPIFSYKFVVVLFSTSDAIALFTSITSLLMFLSILTSRYAEEDFLHVLPKRLSIGLLTLFVSITFMMVAFSVVLFVVFGGKDVERLLIPVLVLSCLPVTSFLLLQFPLVVALIYSTYGPGIFSKTSDRLLY